MNGIQFDQDGLGWLATERGLYSFKVISRDSVLVSKPKFITIDENLHDIEFDSKGNL